MVFWFQTDVGEEVETMWVEPLHYGLFKVDNIPFYVRGVSSEDIVSGRQGDDGRLEFGEVVESGGHSTLRVLVRNDGDVARVCESFRSVGCGWEGSDVPTLIAVDVPPSTPWSSVEKTLRDLDELIFEYEEACLTFAHVPP
ncbi:MAG: DUF4265 domain-containing protein [Deltaproteobacteria bacterium]|nr:DUF4265 domain-containing protein [Deltaproteobacteria bacterium]